VTSPTTRATRRSAARCCGRIEIVPSRRLAAGWLLWLACCLGALLGGNTLPWALRIALGLVLVALNLPALRLAVLLQGARAVRVIEWDEAGQFFIRAARETPPARATLRTASFRLGIAFLALWFSTPAGLRLVLIDGGRQDPIAFRRLSRRLARGELIPSGPKV
jgi:hypothetical protein